MAYTDRFDDIFTEASDIALASHTPTGAGVSWTLVGESSGGVATIESVTDSVNHPFAGGGSQYDGSSADISGTWEDDQEAECDGFANGGEHRLRLGTRIQDDGAGKADGYSGFEDTGSNQWKISRIDSGAQTDLGSFFDSSPATTDVIILQSEGDTHKLFENGTERISVSDSTYSTGGSPGLFTIRSYSGTGLDNFVGRDQGGVVENAAFRRLRENPLRRL